VCLMSSDTLPLMREIREASSVVILVLRGSVVKAPDNTITWKQVGNYKV